MSETFLGEPRFVVTSVRCPEGSFSQVLDRAYCFELVWERQRRATAEKIAEILNDGDFDLAQRYMSGLEQKAAYKRAYYRRFHPKP